jgi:protein-S-isoprenylcysteine O-methyltransferase Ste14
MRSDSVYHLTEMTGAERSMHYRLVFTKVLVVGLFALALVSGQAWTEGEWVDKTFEVLGFLLLAASALGRIWCGAYISGNKNTQLVTAGPFSISRNPLYFFSIVGAIGAGFAFEMLTLVAAFFLVFLITHLPAVLSERSYLAERYGEDYLKYQARVPLLIPRPWLYRTDDRTTFSSEVFDRATREAGLIMLVFLVANASELFHELYPASVLLRLF